MIRIQTDIAVVGSGFAGSILAMIAKQLGRSVVLIERGTHPRFAIGESSTPLTNLLLEALGTRYDLPELESLSKWGRWQATHPELAVGLKRGFSFFHHSLNHRFVPKTDRSTELLVAASPNAQTADTHWFRADFDDFLSQRARARGVVYMDETELTHASHDANKMTLTGTRRGEPVQVTATLTVDASGASGFLSRILNLPTGHPDPMPKTKGVFAHFRDVRPWTEIHAPSINAPVPIDDTALHHVFEGGWIWVLRFNNGIISAGAALQESHFKNRDPAETWNRLLERLPSVADQFSEAKPVSQFFQTDPMGFRRSTIAGPGWVLLPSAAGFVDPLFSTGFPLALLGIHRLAQAIENASGPALNPECLRDYGRTCRLEFSGTAELIAALYSVMDDFEMFTATSMLYFATASFLETQWRLNPGSIGEAFLMLDRPQVGPEFRACCHQVREAAASADKGHRSRILERITVLVEGLDVAGLSDCTRKHWHDVRIEDLFAGRNKLGATRGEIENMLRRYGLLSD